MMNIPDITKQTREEKSLTLEAFGSALAEKIDGYTCSKQNVSQWERGIQLPDRMFLILSVLSYSDWRRDWAQNCLHVLRPDTFAPAASYPETPR